MTQNGTISEAELTAIDDADTIEIGGTEITPDPEPVIETEAEIAILEAHQLRMTIEAGFKNYQAGSHYSYSAIGKSLAMMRDGKKYRNLGYKTMDAVIKDMGKSRSVCYSMMDYNDIITPALVNFPTLTNIDVTTLCKYVIPYLRGVGGGTDDQKTALETIEAIAAHGEAEQADEIRRLRGITTHVDCDHATTEAWVKCRNCGKFIKVNA